MRPLGVFKPFITTPPEYLDANVATCAELMAARFATKAARATAKDFDPSW
jgi:hypothetical protein